MRILKLPLIAIALMLAANCLPLMAQTVPQAFNYQAVVRNSAGQVLANQSIGIKISITDGLAGSSIYSETHNLTTNQFGLINLVVGNGTPTSWAFSTSLLVQGATLGLDSVYLSAEVDIAGGTAYVPIGSSKLQSVPYALVAGRAENTFWSEEEFGNGIYYNNRVGIGTSEPSAGLHVEDSSVLFFRPGPAPTFIPEEAPINGEGRRMMWYAMPAAFRAGYVDGDQWNRDSIGLYSTAFGINTLAYGSGSFAAGSGSQSTGNFAITMGTRDTASGFNSLALGYQNLAFTAGCVAIGYENKSRQPFASALGYQNTAGGENSLALGANSSTIGRWSVAMGYNTFARSFAEIALGAFNKQVSGSINSWNTSDRILVVGNGTSDANRSDAFQIFKSGDVVIGSNGTKITNVQEGSRGAGSQAGSNRSSVNITFPNPFINAANVRVMVTPKLANGITDAFILGVTNITTAGCTVEIFRADAAAGTGWGTPFDIQWMAWE